MTALHPACEPIAFLLGTWRGEGKGHYPTVDDFIYGEEVTFTHDGRPFVVYTQRTWSPDTGAAMHSETGFWRPKDGRIEVVIAQALGLAEIEEGSVDGTRVETETTRVGLTSTAKETTAIRRAFEMRDDLLIYDLWLAAVGQPMTHHLHAELKRVG